MTDRLNTNTAVPALTKISQEYGPLFRDGPSPIGVSSIQPHVIPPLTLSTRKELIRCVLGHLPAPRRKGCVDHPTGPYERGY